ncbi:MAG: radical SAM protein [Planctomycetes bacterium]|nr:radical SAM protein [Planctomycetota bacterium]
MEQLVTRLTSVDHDRGAQGLVWVYAVLSRRARGVSVGVNLQPNNACNWHCVYCQVPGLHVGKSPPVDLAALERELAQLLAEIESGEFYEQHRVDGPRELRDLAFAGNGEPTASPQFAEAIDTALAARARLRQRPLPPLRVITNGSLVALPRVEAALRKLAGAGGEAWFKLDAATDAGLARLNRASTTAAKQMANLERCCAALPTWIQTCVFSFDGAPPSPAELDALERACAAAAAWPSPPRGVLLYGLARPSLQAEAPRIARVEEAWLRAAAQQLARSGLAIDVHP